MIILLSDLHLLWNNPEARLDNLVETQFEKLKFIFDFAVENNAVVLQAGDFFDRPRSWYLLPKFMEFMEGYKNVRIYTVYGQHDTYMYHEGTRHATNLGILEKAGLVTVLDNKPTRIDDCVVYGCSWGMEVPEVKSDGFNILVVHAPIGEESLWPGHEYQDAQVFLRKYKDYSLILCGDIHRKFFYTIKNREILNTGPLVRKEASEYNFIHKPCFGFVSYRKLELIDIPHRPADEVLSRDHLNHARENTQMLDEFIQSVDAGFETGVDFRTNLEGFIKVNRIEDGVVKLISEKMANGK